MSKIDDAYNFYIRHIYDMEIIDMLQKYNLKVPGSVPSVRWELFGAILTGRLGTGTTGTDLVGWEVKSAKMGASFEYQYHLNTGAAKLQEDCLVNHLFCTYSETYKDVAVRVVEGKELATLYFKAWEPAYYKNYNREAESHERRQRFRRSIPFGFIQSKGDVILVINEGKIIERNDFILEKYSTERDCL